MYYESLNWGAQVCIFSGYTLMSQNEKIVLINRKLRHFYVHEL